MLLFLFFSGLAFACFQGLTRDVNVAGLVLLVGFTQDPARKLMDGEPVFMTIMVGVVIVCIALRRVLVNEQGITEPFVKWSTSISLPLFLYLLVIGAQGIHSLLRYKSLILTALGAVFYIAPLVAIVVGYFLFKRFEQLRHFLLIFCCMAIIVAVSIVISYSGVESTLLGEVGSGLIIYDQGTILKAYSGLMRSSEIASWHMGACVCLLIVLLTDRISLPSFILVTCAVALLLGAIILTGRRKMIVQIALFACMYFPMLRYYQGRISTRFMIIILLGFAVLSLSYFFIPSFEGTRYDLYLARGASVFGDAGERLSSLGLGSVGWAYRLHGLFGGGLGIATQGSQHFVAGNVGGAGEGGLGKLVSELGVFALFFIAWLSIAFAVHLHKCISLVGAAATPRLPLVVGCLVFIMANVPTFVVASQVFGDVFVLIILGVLTGALFATPTQVISTLSSGDVDGVKRI